MKLTKFASLALAVVLASFPICLAGCAGNRQQTGAPSGSITVYYLNKPTFTDAISNFKQAFPDVKLETVSFDSASEMDLRISTELGAGKGADVFLFSTTDTTLDTFKMANNGSFYDLSHYVADEQKNKTANFFSGALDSGKINGAQYLLPLSFDIPALFTSEEKMKSEGISLSNSYSFGDLSGVIQKDCQKNRDDDSKAAILFKMNTYQISAWLAMAGVNIVDQNSRRITANKADFEKAAGLAKSVYQTQSKAGNIAKKYMTDFKDSTDALTFIMDSSSFALDVSRYNYLYNSQKSQNFRFITVPEISNSSARTGLVCLYGAVNANSKNPFAAYMLLNNIMNWCNLDVDYGDYGKYDTSINKKLATGLIDALASRNNIGHQPFFTDSLSAGVKDVLNHTNRFVIMDNSVSAIVVQSFQPYLDDKKSFDSCYADMSDKLKVYLSE